MVRLLFLHLLPLMCLGMKSLSFPIKNRMTNKNVKFLPYCKMLVDSYCQVNKNSLQKKSFMTFSTKVNDYKVNSKSKLNDNNTRTATIRNDDSSYETFLSLLNEIRDILITPGMTLVGINRSIQVFKAVNKILLEFVNNREVYLDNNGQISIPKALRRIFEELGATYIKLGQFIASSPTIFPAEYVTEFQACLDNSPTVSYSEIRKIIQDDLKQPLSALFLSVDPTPLACASIAQVHRAILRDGTEVVIKVRKPGVDSTLKADLGFLFIASKIIEFINPSVSAISLSNIVGDIRDSMLDELDFQKEAKNLNNFRSFLSANGITDAVAPKPFPSASGTKVLTMEYLKGVPLVDLEGIKRFTISPEATLISALRTWALSVATNDVFHADVHAGNLLVLEDGRVGFIDFGIVGKISDNFRTAISNLFEAFVVGDYQNVAKALVQMGATKTNVDIVKFGRELEVVIQKITMLQPEILIEATETLGGSSVDARLVVDERETTEIVLEIVTVANNNGLKLPREFGLILKQALYFDRYQKILAPTIDPLRDSRLRDNFGQEVFKYKTIDKNSPKIIDVEAIDQK